MSHRVQTFLSNWGANVARHNKADSFLISLEKSIEASLPNSFRELSLASHKLFCPAISTQLSCRDIEKYDVQDFIATDAILSETDAHIEAGMPTIYLAFAYDCMGNVICFNKNELKAGESKVHVFDHTDIEMKEIASSFDLWLDEFNALMA